jgi:YtkA-like
MRTSASSTSGAAWLAAVLCGGLALAACDDHEPADGTVNCATETRADQLVSGMEKVGERGEVSFRLVTMTPSPPKRPDNAWVIHLERGGVPLDGAAVGVKLFMPDHNHGTGVKPVISAAGTAGDYKIDQLNLWMPGLWELTVDATPAGGSKDQAVFRACIPE